ncbi:YchF/TatD family DNA exonuclease [Hydrogenobacter hydrogenophilus]|uniref:TatD DNase family protein n=1 Tax=Hydrogenobacter hydrogenophilus TaxID=35835 RepID=A0A285P5I7_9AQUI|nr:YchF/TatD family DNA exonuclease [Hydrogenobacter hydrogenophilus]SNZ15416.1 TatD DNase family protein [Hydrogenobacter hydrogenophilus]
MIDTHCHLDLLKKEDLEDTLKDSSLEHLITVGYDRKTIKNALKLAQENERIFCAIGFHPHEADSVSDDDLLWLKELAEKNHKVKAIGEMGLDFYKDYSDRKKQEDVFRKQINIARELGLPIVVHSRDAEEKTIEILREERAYEVGGVIHCFTGSYTFMKKCVDLGFYISYSGIITYKNADTLREVLRKTPTARMLIETDSPFLAPQPVRGKPNKPSYIWYTAEVMAKLIPNSSVEDIDRMTSENAKLLFNIGNNGRKDTITYVINNKLYINLTNKCNLHCAFCQRERERNFMVKGYWVWTSRDPSVEEVIKEIGDPTKYDEIVFCGYGEPTLRFSALKDIAKYVKLKGGKVRVDTNGLMFTYLPEEKLSELKGLVDVWSVSLNAHDEETYNKVCRPAQGDAFSKVIKFIKRALEEGFEVIATAVDYEGVDIERTRKLAESLGAKWRYRPYEVVG